MSIEYRGDNKYRFRVRKDGINYTQNYISDKPISEKELQDKKYPKAVFDEHKKFEVSVMTGNMGTNENMKFGDLAQLVMDEYVKPGRKQNTISGYLTAYNIHLLEEFGDMPINKIKKLQVQKFANKKLKTLKTSSVERILAVMRATFNIAIDWEIIRANPCRKITLPKTPTKNYAELLPADEISRLFAAIDNEPEMYRIIFLIAIGVGLRQGEILGLSIQDIDFNDDSIDVSKQYLTYSENNKIKHDISSTKTDNSIRKAFMPKFVSVALKEYISHIKIVDMKEQYLFVNKKTNKIYDHNAVYRRFKKMLKLNDINEDLTFHDLRHLKAAMMASSGADVVSIAKKLGDTVETVSKTYLHSMNKVEKEATNQFENFVNNIRAK